MENKKLVAISLRYQALYVNVDTCHLKPHTKLNPYVNTLLSRLHAKGFSVEEPLLHALHMISNKKLLSICNVVAEKMQLENNWTPLVKNWLEPTNESLADHIITHLVNSKVINVGKNSTTLPCGHIIPHGTFNLSRYNGCPYCGKPFTLSEKIYTAQGSNIKVLKLYTQKDLKQLLHSLLTSTIPLEGTNKLTLQELLTIFGMPDGVEVPIKENRMLVIDHFIEQDMQEKTFTYMQNPTDILRYLWYKKTSYMQIIEPRTLIKHENYFHWHSHKFPNYKELKETSMKEFLKLKYSRTECLRIAKWINQLSVNETQAAEMMNPKRGMWVRVIRAARLGEYSRRKGFNKLAKVLDVFYNKNYTTFQERLNQLERNNDIDGLLTCLQEKPGEFSRRLFSLMLKHPTSNVVYRYEQIAHNMPVRLLLSLMNSATIYFNPSQNKSISTALGFKKILPPNPLLKVYTAEEREEMINAINAIYKAVMTKKYATTPSNIKSIYIDPMLFKIPINVGDRSNHIQDISCALQGTRFKVESNSLRLFLQWGKGLPSQHLDMDLSTKMAYADGTTDTCYFGNLSTIGAKHSGDIREIPNFVGTAEYIELNLEELKNAQVRYVSFSCNAYSSNKLDPNLVVGWMNSAYKMEVSEKTGVAYDPSCVQHMVRIGTNNASRGLVFGILDVQNNEVIWLEMPIEEQTVNYLNIDHVKTLLYKLNQKVKIGDLLKLKAKAQQIKIVKEKEDAEMIYSYEWALNPSNVIELITAQ